MDIKLVERLRHAQESLKQRADLAHLEEWREQLYREFNAAMVRIIDSIDTKAEYFRHRKEIRAPRKGLMPYWLRLVLSAPIIYGLFIPMTLFHLGLEIYHQACFRLYGIPLVKAKEYFVFDRSLLPHLDAMEKFNCFYCSYYNNLVSYAAEIGARTERFWCPLKYARRMTRTHSYYNLFADADDQAKFRDRWQELRKFEDV